MKLLDVFLAILITLSVIVTITTINTQLQLSYAPYKCFYFDEVTNTGEFADEIDCKYDEDRWTCDSRKDYNKCYEKSEMEWIDVRKI